MLLKDKLKKYSQEGKAILATNFYNFETLSGVLQAAKNKNRAIILQLSESSIHYMGLSVASTLAKSALKTYGVEGWLHLDHGSSLDMVEKCLDAGFDSVMIDASEKPLEENIRISRAAVKLAAQYKANVEAELGYVAKLGQVQQVATYTQPEEARKFVEETGVDALAIAIGSAHGFYKEPPNLQLELLAEIHKGTPAALVLHGSSGIPNAQLTAAIQRGISKVNLATETKNIFMKTLQSVLSQTDEIDLRKVFPVATASVVKLIEDKLDVVSP
jgi:ketose-bisphosphate aldolase